MRRRPAGVSILAVFAILAGIGAFLSALSAFGLNICGWAPPAPANAGLTGVLFGVGFLITAFVQLTFGFGALALAPWAWTLGVALQMLALVEGLVQLARQAPTGGLLIDMLLGVLILIYLNSTQVRRAFGRDTYLGGTRG